MADALERFFNWQTDMDWAWGPFVSLRPPRDAPLRPWVWVRLFMVFTLLGMLLIALLGVICVLGPVLAAEEHWAVPPALAETLATLRAMGNDPSFRWLLIGLGLCLPPVFFLACLPFHVAWNRRAARLAALPEASISEAPVPRENSEVWPPAPHEAEPKSQ